MLGGAKHIVDADLIAKAIVAAAISYGDDPVDALISPTRGRRRSISAAVSGIERALGSAAPVIRIAPLVKVSAWTVYDARKVGKPQFHRAAEAAAEAIRYALKGRELAELGVAPVPAVPPAATAAVIELALVRNPPPSGVEDRVQAVQPQPLPLREANAVRVVEIVSLPVERPRPANPVRPMPSKPYSPDRARPAPAAPPLRPVRHVDARRKAPRGAIVEKRAGGVEVIRLKPVTDSVVRHVRAQLENGLDLGEAADLFDVDVAALETALKAAGVRL